VKKKKKLVKTRTAFYLVSVAIVFYLLFVLAGQTATYLQTRAKLSSLQQKVNEARLENQVLRDEIKNWQDPQFLERQAREKLGMVKEGEISFWITD